MADISLLFDVAGGGSLSGASGKLINDQLTSIINKINENPYKINVVADEKSLDDLQKRILEIKKALGGTLINIDASEVSGITKSLNQIVDSLTHIMVAVGKSSVSLDKMGTQLHDIFEAIPEDSKLTSKSIRNITDSVADLVDKMSDLGATVNQINGKRSNTVINLTGGLQENMEQVTAYREYLVILLRDFNELRNAYQHLMANSDNPRYSRNAYFADAAVRNNKLLLDTLNSFNYGAMTAQSGIMDLGQLKQAVETYQYLIASMNSIQNKGTTLFGFGDKLKANSDAAEEARKRIKEVEKSINSIEETAEDGKAGGTGGIFEYIERIREGIETLNDPLNAIKAKMDDSFGGAEITEERRNAMKASVEVLSNSISEIFSTLRDTVAKSLDFSTLPREGDAELVERMKTECSEIEGLFAHLREQIVGVFDFSNVDTSNFTSLVDRLQEALNGFSVDLGRVNFTGGVGTVSVHEDSANLIRETRQLKDLIPDGVKIDSYVKAGTLKDISDAMQRLSIAEDDAGALMNLFKGLKGTVTEVTAKIIDQGEARERLRNVTIKGIDEEGQAFTRSADYTVRHSRELGDIYESHTMTTRKLTIAQKEQSKAVRDQAKADEEAAKAKEEALDSSQDVIKLTEAENRAWEQHIRNAEEAAKLKLRDPKAVDAAWEKIEKERDAEEKLTRSQINGYDERENAAERAAEQEAAEANSIQRKNKLLIESNDLIARLKNLSVKQGVTDEQSKQINDTVDGVRAFQKAVSDGTVTNDAFASVIGRTRTYISELNADLAGGSAPVKILGSDTKEYADAMKRLQSVMGAAQNALLNYTAAEKSGNESSRDAYKGIADNVEALGNLDTQLRSGTMEQARFDTELLKIDSSIRSNTNIIKANGDAHKSLGDGIAKTIRNFSRWMGVSRIMMAAVRNIKQMVSAVIELDTAMTELRKVTDETESRYDRFLKDASVRAKQIGASLKDTVSATADFARLGYSVDQAEKLADAAIIYKNVGDGISDITEASESIIATMQAFSIKPEDVMSIVDKFNDVGNKFAISSGGVGEALLRSAAAMEAANNTLDETIALATAANKVVQNPQIVGTSLKTISMYLRAAKTEAEEAGIETDDMAESVSKLRAEILRLTGNQVDIQIDEQTFKSTYQILKELAAVWDRLSDVSQANIQALIGQKRNGNIVAALLKNFDEAERVLETSMNAMGSAVQENEKVLNSIQGRINLFKSSFEVLSETIVDGDLVKFIVDAGTWILGFINDVAKLIEKLGGLRTLLIGFSPLLAGLIANSGILSAILTGLKTVLITMISPITNAVAAWRSYAAGVITLGTAMQASLGIITVAITALVAVYSSAKQAERERRQEAEAAAQAASEQGKEIAELVRKYDELSEAVKKDDGVKEELDDVTKRLIESLGVEENAVKRLAGRYGSLTQAIREASAESLRKDRRDLQIDYMQAQEGLVDAAKPRGLDNSLSFINIDKAISFSEKAVLDAFKKQGLIRGNIIYGVKTKTGYTKATFAPNFDLSTPEGVVDAYDKLGRMLDELDKHNITSGPLIESVSNAYKTLSDAVGKYETAVERLNINLLDTYYAENLLGISIPKTAEEFEALRKNTIEQIAAQNKYVGTAEDLTDSVDDMLRSSGRFSKFYEDTATAAAQAGCSISKTSQIITEFREKMGRLSAALQEYRENGSITNETYQDLIASGEEYKDLFDYTNNGIEIQTDKLNSLADSMREEYGAQLALNGATADEISYVADMTSTLVTAAEKSEDIASSLGELTKVLEQMQNGVELSTSDMNSLIEKYPDLRSKVIKTANGYKIEEKAIRNLIKAKADLLKVTERETNVNSARATLVASKDTGKWYVKEIDQIFEQYQKRTGKSIKSVGDFQDQYKEMFGEHLFTSDLGDIGEAYVAYVKALIQKYKYEAEDAKAAAMLAEGYNEGLDGYDPDSSSGSSDKKEETEFEKEYKRHQHLLEMDQENVEQYLAWLEWAYQVSYANEEMTLDDYYKYEEEVYEKRKELFQDSLDVMQHQIDLLDHQTSETTSEQIALYQQMQNAVNDKMAEYRANGIREDDEMIRELQDQWWTYEENIRELREKQFRDGLDTAQHQIDLLSHQTSDTTAEQIALYEQMQREVHEKANEYRAMGISDDNEMIRELQEQWWAYEENIRGLREDAMNDWLNDRKFAIDQMKLDGADSDDVLNSYRAILKRINTELSYYASRGYDETTDVVQSLLNELESAKDEMISYLDDIVSKAGEAVDKFESVYKTLTDAAKEYAETGYLSVDSLQAILDLGPKYLDVLTDENGMLVINEERLQELIAARTKEMAAETALSYAKQILIAVETDELRTLESLVSMNAEAGSATFALAYQTLDLAKTIGVAKGIQEDYFDDAASYIKKMEALTRTATGSIGAYYKTLNDGYISQADAIDTIIKLVEDMIKQESEDRIDALEKEKDLYKDIIDEKKEILKLTKEQDDHDRDMADKLKEIADLQSKIDQLSLDDSREAGAERSKLEKELYEKQKSLADDQADYAYKAQTEALDKQYDEFADEKDKEIEKEKDLLNSREKLHRAAVARITDAWENGWEDLKNQLVSWNYEMGSTLQTSLVAAWDAATEAARRYGTIKDAITGVKGHTDIGQDTSVITNRMMSNSLAWFTAGTGGREAQTHFEDENRREASLYESATGIPLEYRNGSWFAEGSESPLYALDKDAVAAFIVSVMKANSTAWHGADEETRRALARDNEMLADRLSGYLGKEITKTQGGVWMIGSKPLYDIYHAGGIAGGSGTIKQNEVMALLKKGEAVLDEKREQGLYRVVDFVQILSDKLGRVIDSGGIASLLGGSAYTSPRAGIPALAGGIGTMNFSPTVNVTIAAGGDLTESAARQYGNAAADTVLEKLREAFVKRGVGASGNGILK